MQKIIRVAIGSTNPAKGEAVKRVFDHFFPGAEYIAVNAPSGVSDMPLTDEEAVLGAKNRARAAREEADADFGVGLEGNVQELTDGMLLHGIVAVINRDGLFGIGDSGGGVLPEHIAVRIRNGEELGPIMDELTNDTDVKKKMGAVGVFTKGFVSRTDGFAHGVAFALSRFISPEMFIGKK